MRHYDKVTRQLKQMEEDFNTERDAAVKDE